MLRTRVLALGVLVLLGGCDLFGPSVGPPAEITMSPIPADLSVGAVVPSITVTVRDGDGKEVSGASVEWTASHGTVTPSGATDGNGVATASWTLGTVAGPQTLTARVNGLEASRTITVAPGPLAAVVLTPDEVSFVSLGDTTEVTATGEDQYGNEVGLPQLSWTSTNADVATVDGGRVVSQGNGTAQVRARSGEITGTAPVSVEQQRVGVRVTPADPLIVTNETLQLELLAVDARGTPMEAALSITWTSSAPSVADVSPDGLVSGLAVGDAVITGSAGGDSDATTVSVTDRPRPTISSIAPSVLAAGDTATITGTGFSATRSENEVTIAGVQGEVLDASATELVVALPAGGVFPCGPTGDQPVVVTVDRLEATAQHPFAGATQQTLAVGESVALFGADRACNELTQAGTYLVSVFNAATTAQSQVGFRLRGTRSDVPAAAAESTTRERLFVAPEPLVLDDDPEATAHARLLEQNLRIARDLAARHRPARQDPALRTLPNVAVGATRTFRVPDLDSDNICTNYKTVTARAVFSGSTAVIWEDEEGPLAGEMDQRWVAIGQEYEAVMHPILREYFGDPLAYDDWVTNPGRFNMLVTRAVNDFNQPIAGFVLSGDFFPRSACPASDEMAIFYGRIPTAQGTGYDSFTANAWAREMRSTVIHEVKHIVSFAERLRFAAVSDRQPVFEETWLEESTARLAEEFYGRAISGYGPGENVSYDRSVYCEVRPSWQECEGTPVIMLKHFDAIYSYLGNTAGRTPLGSAGANDGTFYGSGWLLVRWAMDHSGMGEAAFTRALMDENAQMGVANLVARHGRPFAQMLADFSLAVAADDHPNGLSTRLELTIPGWSARDIFAGLNDDFPSGFTRAWPLVPRALDFGNFDADVASVRGGSAAFFELSGAGGNRQLLQLMTATGGEAPASLGIGIVRVD